MNNALLTASNITKHVSTFSGELMILNDVTMGLDAGESIAIQGASGSGKSTLLGILAGLDLPQLGSVQLSGKEITGLDEAERAAIRADKVGFVFQSFHLLDDLNALENVALPLELFGYPTPQNTAARWLDRLGLAARKDHFPRQLSGGEQQRVALCRAFAVEPDLLFADEPTANLDQVTAELVADQLFTLQRECGTSMVIATHDRQLASRCDRIYHLRAGELVNPGGTHE